MMNTNLARAFVLGWVLSSMGAGSGLAYEKLGRTFAEPVTRLADVVRADLEVSYSGREDGVRYSGTEDRTLSVRLEITIEGEAPLRPGEEEWFWVDADDDGHGVDFKLAMDTVHDYEVTEITDATPAAPPSRITAVHRQFDIVPRVAVKLRSKGRLRISPPNTIQNVRLVHESADAPFTLAFEDPGDPADGGAVTTYEMVMFRTRSLWFDKKIAEGSVEGTDQQGQALVVRKGGANHVGDEWLVPGATYRLEIQLKKNGEDYSGSASRALKLEIQYPGPAPAGSTPAPARVLFEQLHAE